MARNRSQATIQGRAAFQQALSDHLKETDIADGARRYALERSEKTNNFMSSVLMGDIEESTYSDAIGFAQKDDWEGVGSMLESNMSARGLYDYEKFQMRKSLSDMSVGYGGDGNYPKAFTTFAQVGKNPFLASPAFKVATDMGIIKSGSEISEMPAGVDPGILKFLKNQNESDLKSELQQERKLKAFQLAGKMVDQINGLGDKEDVVLSHEVALDLVENAFDRDMVFDVFNYAQGMIGGSQYDRRNWLWDKVHKGVQSAAGSNPLDILDRYDLISVANDIQNAEIGDDGLFTVQIPKNSVLSSFIGNRYEKQDKTRSQYIPAFNALPTILDTEISELKLTQDQYDALVVNVQDFKDRFTEISRVIGDLDSSAYASPDNLEPTSLMKKVAGNVISGVTQSAIDMGLVGLTRGTWINYVGIRETLRKMEDEITQNPNVDLGLLTANSIFSGTTNAVIEYAQFNWLFPSSARKAIYGAFNKKAGKELIEELGQAQINNAKEIMLKGNVREASEILLGNAIANKSFKDKILKIGIDSISETFEEVSQAAASDLADAVQSRYDKSMKFSWDTSELNDNLSAEGILTNLLVGGILAGVSNGAYGWASPQDFEVRQNLRDQLRLWVHEGSGKELNITAEEADRVVYSGTRQERILALADIVAKSKKSDFKIVPDNLVVTPQTVDAIYLSLFESSDALLKTEESRIAVEQRIQEVRKIDLMKKHSEIVQKLNANGIKDIGEFVSVIEQNYLIQKKGQIYEIKDLNGTEIASGLTYQQALQIGANKIMDTEISRSLREVFRQYGVALEMGTNKTTLADITNKISNESLSDLLHRYTTKDVYSMSRKDLNALAKKVIVNGTQRRLNSGELTRIFSFHGTASPITLIHELVEGAVKQTNQDQLNIVPESERESFVLERDKKFDNWRRQAVSFDSRLEKDYAYNSEGNQEWLFDFVASVVEGDHVLEGSGYLGDGMINFIKQAAVHTRDDLDFVALSRIFADEDLGINGFKELIDSFRSFSSIAPDAFSRQIEDANERRNQINNFYAERGVEYISNANDANIQAQEERLFVENGIPINSQVDFMRAEEKASAMVESVGEGATAASYSMKFFNTSDMLAELSKWFKSSKFSKSVKSLVDSLDSSDFSELNQNAATLDSIITDLRTQQKYIPSGDSSESVASKLRESDLAKANTYSFFDRFYSMAASRIASTDYSVLGEMAYKASSAIPDALSSALDIRKKLSSIQSFVYRHVLSLQSKIDSEESRISVLMQSGKKEEAVSRQSELSEMKRELSRLTSKEFLDSVASGKYQDVKEFKENRLSDSEEIEAYYLSERKNARSASKRKKSDLVESMNVSNNFNATMAERSASSFDSNSIYYFLRTLLSGNNGKISNIYSSGDDMMKSLAEAFGVTYSSVNTRLSVRESDVINSVIEAGFASTPQEAQSLVEAESTRIKNAILDGRYDDVKSSLVTNMVPSLQNAFIRGKSVGNFSNNEYECVQYRNAEKTSYMISEEVFLSWLQNSDFSINIGREVSDSPRRSMTSDTHLSGVVYVNVPYNRESLSVEDIKGVTLTSESTASKSIARILSKREIKFDSNEISIKGWAAPSGLGIYSSPERKKSNAMTSEWMSLSTSLLMDEALVDSFPAGLFEGKWYYDQKDASELGAKKTKSGELYTPKEFRSSTANMMKKAGTMNGFRSLYSQLSEKDSQLSDIDRFQIASVLYQQTQASSWVGKRISKEDKSFLDEARDELFYYSEEFKTGSAVGLAAVRHVQDAIDDYRSYVDSEGRLDRNGYFANKLSRSMAPIHAAVYGQGKNDSILKKFIKEAMGKDDIFASTSEAAKQKSKTPVSKNDFIQNANELTGDQILSVGRKIGIARLLSWIQEAGKMHPEFKNKFPEIDKAISETMPEYINSLGKGMSAFFSDEDFKEARKKTLEFFKASEQVTNFDSVANVMYNELQSSFVLNMDDMNSEYSSQIKTQLDLLAYAIKHKNETLAHLANSNIASIMPTAIESKIQRSGSWLFKYYIAMCLSGPFTLAKNLFLPLIGTPINNFARSIGLSIKMIQDAWKNPDVSGYELGKNLSSAWGVQSTIEAWKGLGVASAAAINRFHFLPTFSGSNQLDQIMLRGEDTRVKDVIGSSYSPLSKKWLLFWADRIFRTTIGRIVTASDSFSGALTYQATAPLVLTEAVYDEWLKSPKDKKFNIQERVSELLSKAKVSAEKNASEFMRELPEFDKDGNVIKTIKTGGFIGSITGNKDSGSERLKKYLYLTYLQKEFAGLDSWQNRKMNFKEGEAPARMDADESLKQAVGDSTLMKPAEGILGMALDAVRGFIEKTTSKNYESDLIEDPKSGNVKKAVSEISDKAGSAFKPFFLFLNVAANSVNLATDYAGVTAVMDFAGVKRAFRDSSGNIQRRAANEQEKIQSYGRAVEGILLMAAYAIKIVSTSLDDLKEDNFWFTITGSSTGNNDVDKQLSDAGFPRSSIVINLGPHGRFNIDYKDTPMSIVFSVLGSFSDRHLFKDTFRGLGESEDWYVARSIQGGFDGVGELLMDGSVLRGFQSITDSITMYKKADGDKIKKSLMNLGSTLAPYRKWGFWGEHGLGAFATIDKTHKTTTESILNSMFSAFPDRAGALGESFTRPNRFFWRMNSTMTPQQQIYYEMSLAGIAVSPLRKSDQYPTDDIYMAVAQDRGDRYMDMYYNGGLREKIMNLVEEGRQEDARKLQSSSMSKCTTYAKKKNGITSKPE